MMLRRLEERAYFWLRVPPEPTPPAGAPGSLQTFRAGKNYLYFRVVMWVGTQVGAIFGLLFSLYFIDELELQIEMERAANQREAAREVIGSQSMETEEDSPPRPKLVEVEPGVYETINTTPDSPPVEAIDPMDVHRGIIHQVFHEVFHTVAPRWMVQLPQRIPGDALFWIKLAETFGLFLFALQFFWTLLAVRIDYAQRWYMVTDRSLRLRWGVVRIQETTMSFANLQQVSVHQGPLQRLLKIADVEVRSAGGGSGEEEAGGDSMHRSVFHAVENAPEIRDLILARLQRFRQAGLGEPDDAKDLPPQLAVEADADGDAITAAREVLAEVRALRVPAE
jgi:hypothetical protein